MSIIVTSTTYHFDRQDGSVCEQGSTFYRMFTWSNRDGSIIDLSSHTGKMQVRRNYNDDLIIEFSTTNGRMSLNSVGEISLNLTAAETGALQPGTFKYDLELTDTINSETFKIIEGKFVISSQVTI